jgi:hypothetical protein
VTDQSWWEERPERLLQETDALDAAGIAWSRADPAAPGGVVELDATVDGFDGPVTVRATYPDEFPHFPPRVTAPNIGLTHHHEHGGGIVCLLASGGRDWLPSMSLAWLLTKQWPKVLAANAGDGTDPDGRLIETDQGEPWTAYVEVETAAAVVVGSDACPPESVGDGPAAYVVTRHTPVLAVVGRLGKADGDAFYDAGRLNVADELVRPAWWVRLDSVPEVRDAASLWQALEEQDPTIGGRAWAPAPERGAVTRRESLSGRQAQLILVYVQEEVARRRTGGGWIALLRYRSGPKQPPGRARAVRVSRAGRRDLAIRAVGTALVQDKTVMVVGAGGLGAAVVAEFAKLAPAELILVDADTVDAAAAVRYAGAFRWAGELKIKGLLQTVFETQPYTRVTALPLHLGRSRPEGASNTLELLRDQVARADLVIDATADLGAQQLLSDLSRTVETAYLQAEATHGVWAGLIALYPPGADLCWVCVQHHIFDKTIPPLPQTEGPGVQPPGCLEPTYPGAGFDLSVLAAQTVRQAVSYLTDGPGGYGPPAGPVITVRLRDDEGRTVLPDWQEHSVGRHFDCGNHP